MAEQRPPVIYGITQRYEQGDCGKLYVTINVHNGNPYEALVTMGKAGGCINAQNDGLARLVSLSLRSGVDVKEIITQLQEVNCGKQKLSCAQAIAAALRKGMEDD